MTIRFTWRRSNHGVQRHDLFAGKILIGWIGGPPVWVGHLVTSAEGTTKTERSATLRAAKVVLETAARAALMGEDTP